jgi:hypothetical protein
VAVYLCVYTELILFLNNVHWCAITCSPCSPLNYHTHCFGFGFFFFAFIKTSRYTSIGTRQLFLRKPLLGEEKGSARSHGPGRGGRPSGGGRKSAFVRRDPAPRIPPPPDDPAELRFYEIVKAFLLDKEQSTYTFGKEVSRGERKLIHQIADR